LGMGRARAWLPGESMPRATPRGVAAVLALALGCLVALNGVARLALDKAGSNLAYGLTDQKWALLREPGSFDPRTVVLVLGDSAGNQGVDPVVLGRVLARGGEAGAGVASATGNAPRVLNLCTVADALAVHDAWMLSRWIEQHGPPAEVVLVHTYDMWYRRADAAPAAAMLARVPVPLWEWGGLRPRVRLSWERWALLLSSRWAPMYAQDASLRELLGSPARTWERVTTRAGTIWQSVDKNGFLSASQARPVAVERDTRGHLGFLRAHTREFTAFRLSEDNLAGLQEIARLGEEHGFRVWLAAAPMYRGLWESPAMQTYHGQLRARLRRFDRRHPSVGIVLSEPVRFEMHQMQNADHTVETAAAEYARVLGEAIRRGREE